MSGASVLMYDWSFKESLSFPVLFKFQLLLKGCTIEATNLRDSIQRNSVSVVVERMYDWSVNDKFLQEAHQVFQLLLKGCTIEAVFTESSTFFSMFQLLLKGCTIEASPLLKKSWTATCFSCCWKDVRLKLKFNFCEGVNQKWFSCCWKDVRLKH